MATFAESFIVKLDLPYSEYWMPLAIGMVVGVCALTVSKLVFVGKKNTIPRPKPSEPEREHDPFTQGSANEQRKSFRRRGNLTEVYIAFPDQKDRPWRGWVLNRSMGGVCLQVNFELKEGDQVAVLPVNAPNITPWVDIEVRSCRFVQDGYELGCQFLKTPAWSILLMFG